MGFLKKVADVIARPTQTRTMGVVLMLVLVSIVSLTVIVAQQQQQIRQRAVSPSCANPFTGYESMDSLCLADCGSNPPDGCTDECKENESYKGLCESNGYTFYIPPGENEAGGACYQNTKVGNPCTINGITGKCNSKGDCAIPTPIPSCEDVGGSYFCTASSCKDFGENCLKSGLNKCSNDTENCCYNTCSTPTPTPFPIALPTSTLTPTQPSTPTIAPTVSSVPTAIPSVAPIPLAADVNQDGCISISDFNEWLYAYNNDDNNRAPRNANYKPDINRDSKVDLEDYKEWYRSMKSGQNLCG